MTLTDATTKWFLGYTAAMNQLTEEDVPNPQGLAFWDGMATGIADLIFAFEL